MGLHIDLPMEARRHIIARLALAHPIPTEFRVPLPTSGDSAESLTDSLGEDVLLEVDRVVCSEHAQICVVTSSALPSSALLYFPMSVAVDAPADAVLSLAERVVEEDSTLSYFEPSGSHPMKLLGTVKYAAEVAVSEMGTTAATVAVA